MNTKHSKAKAEFWEAVRQKCTVDGQLNVQLMMSAIDYMLDQLPTWAVDKAITWIKRWQP